MAGEEMHDALDSKTHSALTSQITCLYHATAIEVCWGWVVMA